MNHNRGRKNEITARVLRTIASDEGKSRGLVVKAMEYSVQDTAAKNNIKITGFHLSVVPLQNVHTNVGTDFGI